MAGAVGEMEAAKAIAWDGYIVNNDVHEAYAQLRALTARARAARAAVVAAAAAAPQAGK